MEISELIEQGKQAAEKCKQDGTIGPFYSGPEYEKWLAISTRFVEKFYPNDTDTKRYREIAEKAGGDGDNYLNKLIAILEAFKQFPPEK